MRKYNVAVIGVGAVGKEMLRCLHQRSFPFKEIRVFARSQRDIAVEGVVYRVEAIKNEQFDNIDIALFAGTEGEKGASLTYAHKFVEKGAVVIDNGADFRLDQKVPLVVPEANREKIFTHQGIIANPNCTTIQAIVALAGIYKKLGLKKIILTSFQASSGAGRRAMETLWEETKEIVKINEGVNELPQRKKLDKSYQIFPCQLAFNVIPQIGSFEQEGYTTEEWKVVRETHKILDDNSIKISATCVRVPVFTSHSEAIYFETEKDTDGEEIGEILKKSKGVKFFEDNTYPLPLDVEGTDLVYVGRLRKDIYNKNSFWIWVVADNLRKGAALNAIQIAEELLPSL
ncbi:MAG: aspartate-semialdehyde dehydrogenase [Candidatus Omnitrophica bacterium]|nr:aspartate-semialdehyde dehydrogenase [Candidatus Omnitrophota bacterium]